MTLPVQFPKVKKVSRERKTMITIFVCIRTDYEGRSEIIAASENESAMDEYRDLLALENQAFGLKYGNPSFCVQDILIDEDAFQSNLVDLRSQKEAFEQKIAKNKREHVERQTKDLQQRLNQLDSKLADLLKNKQ